MSYGFTNTFLFFFFRGVDTWQADEDLESKDLKKEFSFSLCR